MNGDHMYRIYFTLIMFTMMVILPLMLRAVTTMHVVSGALN
jgi:hypothetical protein